MDLEQLKIVNLLEVGLQVKFTQILKTAMWTKIQQPYLLSVKFTDSILIKISYQRLLETSANKVI